MRKLFLLLLIVGCAKSEDGSYCFIDQQKCYDERGRREELRQREEPCADQSRLLATTAGSPNDFKCPNKLHRMQVQIATTSSNEEIGALVFCKCVRPEEEHDQ